MENEEGNTASPEKYWLDRWEKMEGDQVTEMCVCVCGGGPQEGVVSSARGCRQAKKDDTDKDL